MPSAARVALTAALLVVGCKGVATLAPSGAVIRMFAAPDILVTGGQATLTISAFEASGQPVPDGTVIHLTTTLGALQPDAVQILGGRAEATFRAGEQTGSAEITATSGSATPETITVVIGGAAAMTLSASPPVLPTGGGSTTISATVLDLAGNPEAGAVVTFSTDVGNLTSGGAPRPTSTDGVATDTLTTVLDAVVSAAITGTMVVETIAVDVLGTGVDSVTLTASPTLLPAGGGRSALTAQAFDADGAALAGVPLVFTATAGSIANLGARLTNLAGVATNSIDTDQTATVTVTTGTVSDQTEVSVEATPANAIAIELTVDPDPTTAPITQAQCSASLTGCATTTDACLEIILTATVTRLGEPHAGASVLFVADRPTGLTGAIGTAVPAGSFCVDGQSVVTGANGVATGYYTLSLSELGGCQAIVTPCSPSTLCNAIFQCCCAVEFTARVDDTEDSVTVPILAAGGARTCACTF